MEHSEEIHILLQRISGKPKALGLVNTYKALPVSYPATVLMVGKDIVCVQSEQLQMVCLAREGYTFLQNDLFPAIVRAQVSEVDFLNDQALLYNFSYEKKSIGKRLQVRVEPSETIVALFHSQDEEQGIVCEIADLSLDGLAIYVAEDVDITTALPAGVPVLVHFRLPIGSFMDMKPLAETLPSTPPLEKDYRLYRKLYIPTPLMSYPSIWGKVAATREMHSTACSVRGIVANLFHDTQRQRYRIGFRLFPGGASRSVISKYIVQRQSEIIHDIRDKYDMIAWLVSNEKQLQHSAREEVTNEQ